MLQERNRDEQMDEEGPLNAHSPPPYSALHWKKLHSRIEAYDKSFVASTAPPNAEEEQQMKTLEITERREPVLVKTAPPPVYQLYD